MIRGLAQRLTTVRAHRDQSCSQGRVLLTREIAKHYEVH
jgi:hypothetical protein